MKQVGRRAKYAQVLGGLFVLMGTIGLYEASAADTLYFDTNGVVIQDYQLDFDVMSVILNVQVSESPATVELTIDRAFFDSVDSNLVDNEFSIFVEGDLLPYVETKTTPDTRTLRFHLASEVEEVEIFGTTLQGQTLEKQTDISIIESEINSKINEEKQKQLEEKTELSNQVKQLEKKLEQLDEKNRSLQDKNQVLDNKIFDYDNFVIAIKEKINDLQVIVMEQINLILAWINSIDK